MFVEELILDGFKSYVSLVDFAVYLFVGIPLEPYSDLSISDSMQSLA